jgi:superfamily II DNA helicase RecQ
MNPELHTELKIFFGFSSFRPGQEEATQSLLNGKHTVKEAEIESCGLDLLNLY